jgi:hypothetical protein
MADEVAPHKAMPVPGFTNQTDAKLRIVTQAKYLEELCLRHADMLRTLGDACDQRNVSLGITMLEDAFMRLNRAVFKPTRVKLPGENPPAVAADAPQG